MAYGVVRTEKPMKFEQALHGYADGHRLLATSAQLTPRDQRTLLMMSDIAGNGLKIGEDGYLTGYPLAESGVYALARTWSATEMSRPGCVWTHTVLIDFADMAIMPALEDLLTLFRRPSIGEQKSYATHLTHLGGGIAARAKNNSVHISHQLLAALYEHPNKAVVATAQVELDVESLAIKLWTQQWPKLRRTFKFCTLTSTDRSSELMKFDLQFIPPEDRGAKSRFRDCVDADVLNPPRSQWIQAALSDLIRPEESGLRAFLTRTGADVGSGRGSFKPLCEFYEMLHAATANPEHVSTAISFARERFGTNQARSLKAQLVNLGIKSASYLPADDIDFLLENIDLIDSNVLANDNGAIFSVMWNRDPVRFSDWLMKDSTHHQALQAALKNMSEGNILTGIRKAVELTPIVIAARPSILTSSAFWEQLPVDASSLLSSEPAQHEQERIVIAIVAAHRFDLLRLCLSKFGARAVLSALANSSTNAFANPVIKETISQGARDSQAVTAILRNRKLPSGFVLELSKAIAPEYLKSLEQNDPWLVGGAEALNELRGDDQTFFASYLLCRALGKSSSQPSELAKCSFETVYAACRSQRLSRQSWSILEPYLPEVPALLAWFDWDRSIRLRIAVSGMFIEKWLSQETFASLVRDEKLFDELIKTSASLPNGVEYLRSVIMVEQTSHQRKNSIIRLLNSLDALRK